VSVSFEDEVEADGALQQVRWMMIRRVKIKKVVRFSSISFKRLVTIYQYRIYITEIPLKKSAGSLS
jgi:hypothetical protein